ncbi:MAG: DUF2163 domain-containing protein [Hyphomicrobiaceae bacterium]|nr:DUF2163 domain-containing protein [Hyphomicrobiaceae bacterium]
MKVLPPGLQAHLDSGVTTLCWCWRLTRRDGVRIGFTDHDRGLDFDGTAFEAAAGFTATEMKHAIGLGVDNLEVESALASDRLGEDDLAAGLYDDARVEIFRVNWSDPEQRVLMRAGSLGEVSRSGSLFRAEVRGLSHYLQQPSGRLFQFTCDADLGDGRCGVDLESGAYRGSGSVSAVVSARAFEVTGLEAFADRWFSRGLLTFKSGANVGRAIEIRVHRRSETAAAIELWQEPSRAVAVGDAVEVTAGCDKQLATCRERFANAVNFRGFPHMPGNDFVTSYLRRSAGK